MKRRHRAVILLGMVAAASLPLRAQAARPVEVTVETVTHPIRIAPMAETTNYPADPPRSVLGPIQEQLDARTKAFEAEYDAAHAAEYEAARAAYDEVRSLPRDERKSPRAQALSEKWNAYRRARREALFEDSAYQRLRGKLDAARASVYETKEATFPVVTLSNGRLEVKVVPTLGMRVWNALDLGPGVRAGGDFARREDTPGCVSLAGSPDPRAYEKQVIKGNLAWTAGYVEPSFPSHEHGMFTLQPAGYRLVRGEDGSATVAMNMRFAHHQDRRELARYGRYSQRTLSGWVTLRPGETRYCVTYRVDNPNPLRRSSRLWVNVLMEAARYDGRHVLYPAGYVTGHGANGFDAFKAPGGQERYVGVSHFAVLPDYGFCGVYSPERDVNCLVFGDPQSVPGMKLYTPRGEGGFLELWRGTNPVFEHSGWFLDPYVPTQMTLTFWAARCIGRVDYANADVAIAVDESKGRFAMVSPRKAEAEVTDGAGRTLARGPVGPDTPLRGKGAKRLVVQLDGEQVVDVAFPLVHRDVCLAYAEQVRPLGGEHRPELETIAGNHGVPSPQNALRPLRAIVEAGEAADVERTMSYARCAYRLGHLDLVSKALALLPADHADADYLRGLVAWERGEEVDFGRAGPDSYYHRAMLALQKGERRDAVAWLEKLIAARPDVYRPRLMQEFLTMDPGDARRLAAGAPASPEAQLVLELLHVRGAREAKEALLRGNPAAAEGVEAFRRELTEGRWEHVRRYELLRPE